MFSKNLLCLVNIGFLHISHPYVLHCALYSVFPIKMEAASLSTVTPDPRREGEITV